MADPVTQKCESDTKDSKSKGSYGPLDPDKMLRPPEVMERTGLSRTTLWRRVRAGTFPAPVELGENSIGWPSSAITAWLENRPQRTYGAKAPYQPVEPAAA